MALDKLLKEATSAARTPEGIMRSYFRRLMGRAIVDSFDDLASDLPNVAAAAPGSIPNVSPTVQSVLNESTFDPREIERTFQGLGFTPLDTEHVDAGKAFVAAVLSMAEAAGATEQTLKRIDFDEILQNGLRSLGGGNFAIDTSQLQNQPARVQEALDNIGGQLTGENIVAAIEQMDAPPPPPPPPPAPTPGLLESLVQRLDGPLNRLANLLPTGPLRVPFSPRSSPQQRAASSIDNTAGPLRQGDRPDENTSNIDLLLNRLGDSADSADDASAAPGRRFADSEPLTNPFGEVLPEERTEENTSGIDRLLNRIGDLREIPNDNFLGRTVTESISTQLDQRNGDEPRSLFQRLTMAVQKGGASIGEAAAPFIGASPEAGARAGAALGGIAPPVLAAIAAFSLISKIAGTTVSALNALADQAALTTDRISRYNGAIAGSQATLDASRTLRDIELGGETQASAVGRIASQNRLEEALQPFDEFSTDLGNSFSEFKNDLFAFTLETLNPILEFVNNFSAVAAGEQEMGQPMKDAMNGLAALPGMAGAMANLAVVAVEMQNEDKAGKMDAEIQKNNARQLAAFEAMRNWPPDRNRRV